MKTKEHQYSYSEELKDGITSHAQTDGDKVKFKMIDAYSESELEKAVNEFLAGDIKLVDWKFNLCVGGYYFFTCTYQELSGLD